MLIFLKTVNLNKNSPKITLNSHKIEISSNTTSIFFRY